jgi:hypothetical protein
MAEPSARSSPALSLATHLKCVANLTQPPSDYALLCGFGRRFVLQSERSESLPEAAHEHCGIDDRHG